MYLCKGYYVMYRKINILFAACNNLIPECKTHTGSTPWWAISSILSSIFLCCLVCPCAATCNHMPYSHVIVFFFKVRLHYLQWRTMPSLISFFFCSGIPQSYYTARTMGGLKLSAHILCSLALICKRHRVEAGQYRV